MKSRRNNGLLHTFCGPRRLSLLLLCYESYASAFLSKTRSQVSILTSCTSGGVHNDWLSHRIGTSLFVSELHVPGYAQTKLPFILTEGNEERHNQHSLQRMLECEYSQSDFDSMIPHENGHLLHKTRNSILTPEECRRIIEEAEEVASQVDWTRNRHGNFPTTDLPIVEMPQTLEFFKVALVERIYPLLRAQFGTYLPDPRKLRVADGFVVKYDANGGQVELKPHRDGSVLSFNIALNPAQEYEGGGTWFASLNDAVKIEQGEICSHASALLHGGHGITRGLRYILVAFVILEGFDNWSMRFYNQVRNS